ncbi:zinc-binding alcohol dehydrogenase family protein [Acidicapsa dinghuensis]|uniref:Zinc-binding alcohol dehydrogenase family protein n=1 Tax=Acidicapsa dinghuensis TaxID=2218256 RepID=A0ABW1EB05_9BACT|nr:zinc-binding alcohol dehydrogenase family protein [Acidicapsa dinghuensis]
MQAAVVNVLGQPPQFQEFSDSVAGQGEVVVKMLAAGLHPIVKSRASGAHYSSSGKVPLIPGIDGVGELDGKLVYCFGSQEGLGTMAEKTVARPENCYPLPPGLDPLQAAAIANPGMSAWLSLKLRAALKPGESVLILGATGVAGQLAVQAARQLGASRIIGAGRNVDALRDSGVDAIITLTDPEEAISRAFADQLSQGGFDVVIDYLWGRPTELFLGALAKSFRPDATRSTRLIEVGESAGKTIALPGALLRSVDLTLSGSGFGSVPLKQVLGGIQELLQIAAEGRLQVAVEPVPLAEVTEAWGRTEKGKRVVFTIE